MTQPNQNQPQAQGQGQNQGQQNQQNSGRNQRNRQQQPPKPKCPHCQTENQTGNNCTNCGKKLTISCGGCGAVVKNTIYCSNCGAQLNELPAAQQPIAKNKTEKWELEVTPTGDGQGNYTIAIQVTKNGKGEKCQVYVAIGANSATHETDDKGFLIIQQAVNVRRARLMVDVIGCQANTENRIFLYGGKPNINGGFWANFLAREGYHRQH